jgi:hypothetical protein
MVLSFVSFGEKNYIICIHYMGDGWLSNTGLDPIDSSFKKLLLNKSRKSLLTKDKKIRG